MSLYTFQTHKQYSVYVSVPASPLRAFSTITPLSSSCLCFSSTCCSCLWIIWNHIHIKSVFSLLPWPHSKLSSGRFTWALWSLFNCSCLACLWTALCTRLVIWMSRSPSSSSCPPWNRVSLTLRLEGSFGWTRTPKISVGQEDCLSESWRGSFTERLWDTTNNSVSWWQSDRTAGL